jgi:hypothetical protein
MGAHVIWVGLLMGIGTAAVFAWAVAQSDLVRAHGFHRR